MLADASARSSSSTANKNDNRKWYVTLRDDNDDDTTTATPSDKCWVFVAIVVAAVVAWHQRKKFNYSKIWTNNLWTKSHNVAHTRALALWIYCTRVPCSCSSSTSAQELITQHILRHNCAHSKLNFSASFFCVCCALFALVFIPFVRYVDHAVLSLPERESAVSNVALQHTNTAAPCLTFRTSESCMRIVRNVVHFYSRAHRFTRVNPNINATVIRLSDCSLQWKWVSTVRRRCRGCSNECAKMRHELQWEESKCSLRGRERDNENERWILRYLLLFLTVTVPIWKGRTRIEYLLPASKLNERNDRNTSSLRTLESLKYCTLYQRMQNRIRSARPHTESLVPL